VHHQDKKCQQQGVKNDPVGQHQINKGLNVFERHNLTTLQFEIHEDMTLLFVV
jgi:hypothetical protein